MWNIRRLNKPFRSGKKDFFVGGSGLALIAEAAFVKMLHVEQKRTERSSRQHCTCGGAVTRSVSHKLGPITNSLHQWHIYFHRETFQAGTKQST
jgi:hypothetical protein